MNEIQSIWIRPLSIKDIPSPSIVFDKGVCALLDNNSLVAQKNMRGFRWDDIDNKFYYHYKEVLAWTYCITKDELSLLSKMST